MIKLAIREGASERDVELSPESFTAGRSAENPLDLADPKASRRHASFTRTEWGYRLNDLSKNGLLLNGHRVEEAFLKPGDVITIGDTRITVLSADVPAAAAAPAPAAPPATDRREAALELLRSTRERREWLTRGVAAALLLTAVAIGWSAVGRLRETPAPPPAAALPQEPPALRSAQAELRRFQARVDAAPRATSALLDEAVDLCCRHNGAFPPSPTGTPFDQIYTQLLQRRAREEIARLVEARERIDAALRDRTYAEALEILKSLSTEGTLEGEASVLAARVTQEIREDFRSVDGFGKSLESLKLYADAAEHYRTQAGRFAGTEHHKYLADKPSILERLERAEADTRAPAVAAATPAAVPQDAPRPAPSPLFKKLLETINAGKIPGLNFATETELTRGRDKVPWASVPPEELLGYYSAAGLKDDDLPALADWTWEAGLKGEAAKLLGRYLGGDRTRRQAVVDQKVAAWRGVAAPKGGYTYDAKYGFEDGADRLNRTAATKVPTLCKTLAVTTDPKSMDKVFREVLAFYDDPDLRSTLKESIRSEAITALRSNKEKRLKAIERKAQSATGLETLRKLKLDLNKRREAAIRLIYDAKVYLPENHPDWRKGDDANGQTQVDALVKAVAELWEKAGSAVVQLDSSLRKDVDLVTELNTKYLADLGVTPTENELKAYETVLLNLDAKVDLKNFCLDEKERRLWNWNRAVDRYNEALADPGVTAEEKAHAKVVNEYREMMGMARLFLDARLCRATKKHSDVQNAAQRIWHVGSDGDPQSRARNEGFPGGVGENVAIGYAHPEDVWKRGWYRASDHHRNGLMDAWNCMGYGYAGNVGTQNFSNIPAPASLPPR